MPDPNTRTSKFLSLVLRHRPQLVGIEPDGAGWVTVDALLRGARAAGHDIDRSLLEAIVAGSDKQRFALSEDGARIRANQGHSIAVDLGLSPEVPPALLYHGTVEAALPSIRAHGLQRRKRHHVHLSADWHTATDVGARRGAAIVLTIDAAAMAAAGHKFHVSANGVWLAAEVPVEFIRFPG